MTTVALVFVGGAVLAWLLGRWARGRAVGDESWLPATLRGAELAHAERKFRSVSLKLVARVDRVYRARGELSLVELKTREMRRVYPSDVIELSAQKVAIEESTGEPVSDIAYVLVRAPGDQKGKAIKVHLLPASEIGRLVQRYRSIMSGEVCGVPAASRRMCDKCAYLEPCRRTYGDR
jgi:CRISPR-associated exonuclease Cas4